jgi:quinol-cytochrome oxidoreductase complex cytochrome b subunit
VAGVSGALLPLATIQSGQTQAPIERRDRVMTASAVIIYVIFCLLTGLCGIQRRMGFFGTFILALLVTPIPVLLVLLLTAPSRRYESRRRVQRY